MIEDDPLNRSSRENRSQRTSKKAILGGHEEMSSLELRSCLPEKGSSRKEPKTKVISPGGIHEGQLSHRNIQRAKRRRQGRSENQGPRRERKPAPGEKGTSPREETSSRKKGPAPGKRGTSRQEKGMRKTVRPSKKGNSFATKLELHSKKQQV